MSTEEIKNTSGLLIIAGSETTSTLLSGVTYYLLANPDAYAKVQKEIRGAFQKPEEMTLLTTSKLPYLHACLEEALRLYPPTPLALPRRTGKEGAIIDGVAIPGNVSWLFLQTSSLSNRVLTINRYLWLSRHTQLIMPPRTSPIPNHLYQNVGCQTHLRSMKMIIETR